MEDRLATLNLSRIPIITIPPPRNLAESDPNPNSQSQSQSFPISSLILLDSPLSDWTSIDSLAKWFPILSSLRFLSLPPSNPPPPPALHANVDTDVVADPRRIPADPTKARPFLIAKLPLLSQLNSTPLSPNERRDAELFYVGFVSGLATTAGWARYEELCELYGRPVQSAARIRDTSLKSRMISRSHFSMSACHWAGDGEFLSVGHWMMSRVIIAKRPRTRARSGRDDAADVAHRTQRAPDKQ
jgi:hypothetical protein